MSPTAKVHVTYTISFLVLLIIGLMTIQWGRVPDLVDLLAFALTLTSIVLSLLAIVYAFVSNTSLAQSLGQLGSVSGEFSRSSESLAASTRDLEGKIAQIPMMIGEVSQQVAETHELVRGMSNLEPAPPEEELPGAEARDPDSVIRIASSAGKIALLIAAAAYESSHSFDLERLVKETGFEAHRSYIWGWLMALDAIGVIDVRMSKEIASVAAYEEGLLTAIKTAADAVVTGGEARSVWNEQSIRKVRVYFDAEDV